MKLKHKKEGMISKGHKLNRNTLWGEAKFKPLARKVRGWGTEVAAEPQKQSWSFNTCYKMAAKASGPNIVRSGIGPAERSYEQKIHCLSKERNQNIFIHLPSHVNKATRPSPDLNPPGHKALLGVCYPCSVGTPSQNGWELVCWWCVSVARAIATMKLPQEGIHNPGYYRIKHPQR